MLKQTKKRYLFSTFLFLFLCLATIVGFVLLKRNQDNRQQASEVATPPHLLSPSPSGSLTPTPTTAPGSDLNKKGVVSTSYTGSRPSSQSSCGGKGVWMNDFCYMPGDELAGGKLILASGRYSYPYIEDKKTYESISFGAETVKKVVGTTQSLGDNCGGQGLPISGTCYAYGSTVNGYLVMPPRTSNCNNATGDYCYAFLKKVEVPYVDWQKAVETYEKTGDLKALEDLYKKTYGISFNAGSLYNAGASNADLLKAQAILSALTSASSLQQQAAAENAELAKKGKLTPQEQAVFDFNQQIIKDQNLATRYQVLDQLNQSTSQQLTISTAVGRLYQDLVTAENDANLSKLAKEKFIAIFGYDPSEKYGNLDGILGAFGIDSSQLSADRKKYTTAIATQEQNIDKLNEEYRNYLSDSEASIENLKKAAIDAGVVTADQLKGLSEADALALLLSKFSDTSITQAKQDATTIVTARNNAVQEQNLVENFMNRGPQDSTMSDLSELYTLYTGKSVNINVGPDDRTALKAFLEAEVTKHNPQVALSLFAQTQNSTYLKNYYANSNLAHSYGTWIPDDPKLLLSSIYGSAVGNELYTELVLPGRFSQAVNNFTLDGGASLTSVCKELKVTNCNINSTNSTQTISLMLDKMYGNNEEVNIPDLAVTYSNQIYAKTKEEKKDSFWDLFIASVAMSNAGSGNYVYMENSPQVSYYQESMDNYSAAVEATKIFNASQTFSYATANREALNDYTWGLSYGNALMDDNILKREFTREELGLTVGQTINLTFNQLSSQWANVDVAQNIATNYATSKYYNYTGPADTGIANVALLGANNLGVLDYNYQAATGGYYAQKTLNNWGEEIGAFMVNAGSIYAASQMNETAINQSLYFGEENLTIIDPIEYAQTATEEFRAGYSQDAAVKLYQTYLESTKADGATPVNQVTFEQFINDPEVQRSREELNYERLEKVVAPVAAAVLLPAMIVSGAGVPLLLGMSSSAFSLYQGAGMKAQALEIQRIDIESRENAIVQSYIEDGASEQEIADLKESLDLQVAQLNQQGNLMLANSAVAAITSTGGFLTGLANAGTTANTANLLATSGQVLTKVGQAGGIALNSYNAVNSGISSYNAFSEGNIGGGIMSGLSSAIAATGVAGNAFGLLGPTTYTNRIDYALDRLNIPAGMAVDAQQVSLACFGSGETFSEKDCTNAWIGLALSAGQNVSQVSSSRRAYIGDVSTAKLTDFQKQLNAVDVEILSLRSLGNNDPIIARQIELLRSQHDNLSAEILALNPNLRINSPDSIEGYLATKTEILGDLNTRLAAARQAGNGDLEINLNRQIQLFEGSTDQVVTLRNQIESIDRQVQEGGLSLKIEELADLQRQRTNLVADLETATKDLSVVEALRLQNEAIVQTAKQNEAIDIYREALNKLEVVEAYTPKVEDIARYEADVLKVGKVQLETEDSKRLLSIAAMQESASKLAKLEADRQNLLKADPNSGDTQKALASVEAQIASLKKVTDSAQPSLWQRAVDFFASDKASRTAYYKALSLSTEAETVRVKLAGLDPASPEAATARRQVADLDRQILDQKYVLTASLSRVAQAQAQALATVGEQFSTLRDNYNEFLANQDRLVKLSAELAKLPKDMTTPDQALAFQRLTAEINALGKRNVTLEASLLRDVVDASTKQKLLGTPKNKLTAELEAAWDAELVKVRNDLGLTSKQRRLVNELLSLREEAFNAKGDDLTLARAKYNDKLTELNSNILGRNPDLAAYQKLSSLQKSLKNIALFDGATRNPDALADLLNSKESAVNLDDQLLSLKMETMIRETEFRAGVEEGLAFFNSRVNQVDTLLKIISDPRVAVELTTAGGKTFVGALVLKAQVELLGYATGLYIAKPGQEAKITRDLARMYGVPESDVVALDYTRLSDKAYVASLLRSRYIVADPANLEFVRNGANNFTDGNFLVANQVYRKLTQKLSIYMDELQINIDPTRQAIVSVGASSEKIPTRYTSMDEFVGGVLGETVLRGGGWGLGDNDFLVLRTSEGAEIAKFSSEAQEQIFTALANKMGLNQADYNLIKDNVFALDEALSKGRGDLEQRLKTLGSKLSTDQAEQILDQIDSVNTFAQGLKMKDGTDYKRMVDRVLQKNNGLNRPVTVPASGAVANEGQSYSARLQSVMEYIGAKAHGQTPDFNGLTASPSLAYKSNIADYIGDLRNSSIGAVTGAMADGFGVVETALGLTSYRSTEAVVKILDLENSSTGGRINVDRAYQIDRSDDISALVALKVNGQLNQSAGLATKGNLKVVLGFDGAKEPLAFAIGMARSRQFNQAQFAVQNSDGSYSLVKIDQGGQVLDSRPITTGEIQDMYRGGAENLITIIGRGGATGDSIATNKSVLGVTVTSFDSPEGLVAQAGARIDRTGDVADQFALIVKPGAPRVRTSADLAVSKMAEADFLSFRAKVLEVQIAVEKAKNTQALNQGVTSASTRVLADLIRNSTDPAVQRWASEKLLDFYKESTGRNLSLTGDAAETILARQRQLANEVSNWQKLLQDPANAAILRKVKGTDGDFYQRMLVNSGVDPAKLKYASGSRTQIAGREAVITAGDLGEFISKHSKYVTQDSESRYVADSSRQPNTYQSATAGQQNPVDVAQNQARTGQAVEALQKLAGGPVEAIGNLFLRGIGASNTARLTHLIERSLPRINAIYGRASGFVAWVGTARSRIANAMADRVDRVLLALEAANAPISTEPVQTAAELQAETQAEPQTEPQAEPVQPVVEPNNESAVAQQAPRPVTQTAQGGGVVAWFKATNSRVANAIANQIDKWFFADQLAPTALAEPAEFVAVEHEEEIEAEIVKLRGEAKAEKLAALQSAQAEVSTLETQQSDLQAQAENQTDRDQGATIRALSENTYRLNEARTKVAAIEAEIATIDGQDYRPQAIANLEAANEQGQEQQVEAINTRKGLLSWLLDLSSSSTNGRLLSLLISPEQFLQSKKTPFDVSEELIVLRQTKPNTWQRSMMRKLFRERYAAQLRGIALFREEVEKVFNADPNTSLDQLNKIYDQYQKQYALPNKYRQIAKDFFDRYQVHKAKIADFKARFEGKDAEFMQFFIDSAISSLDEHDSEVARSLFDQYPITSQQISYASDHIVVRLSGEDYAKIFNNDGSFANTLVKWSMYVDENDSQGSISQNMSGIIFFNSDYQASFDQIMSHEKQHVLHWAMFNMGEDGSVEKVRAMAADEILAYFQGGFFDDPRDIIGRLEVSLDGSSKKMYDYFNSEGIADINLKKTYNKDLELAVNAYQRLKTAGYSHAEVRAIFEGEDMVRWPRLANRLSIEHEETKTADLFNTFLANVIGKATLHTIGLANNNSLQLLPKFSDVSANHAQFIRTKQGGLAIKDLNSQGGTHIDGSRIEANKEIALEEGQFIYLGEMTENNGLIFFVVRRADGRLDIEIAEDELATKPKSQIAVSLTDLRTKAGTLARSNWPKVIALGNNLIQRLFAEPETRTTANSENQVASRQTDEIIEDLEENVSREESPQEIEERTRLEDLAKNYAEADEEVARLTSKISDLRATLEEAERNKEMGSVLEDQLASIREQIASADKSISLIENDGRVLFAQRNRIDFEIDELDGQEVTTVTKEQQAQAAQKVRDSLVARIDTLVDRTLQSLIGGNLGADLGTARSRINTRIREELTKLDLTRELNNRLSALPEFANDPDGIKNYSKDIINTLTPDWFISRHLAASRFEVIRQVDPNTERNIVAVGDVHGDWNALVRMLSGQVTSENGDKVNRPLVDRNGNWIGGPTDHLILTGDLFDRAPSGVLSSQTAEKVMRLQQQAGNFPDGTPRVKVLIGNHDVNAIYAYWRMKNAMEERVVRSKKDAAEFASITGMKPGITPEDLMYLYDHPAVANWVMSLDAMTVRDGVLYMHSDIIGYLDYGLTVNATNSEIRAIMQGKHGMEELRSLMSVLTKRGQLNPDNVDELLATYKAKTIVHGHSENQNTRDPRVVNIDGGLSEHYAKKAGKGQNRGRFFSQKTSGTPKIIVRVSSDLPVIGLSPISPKPLSRALLAQSETAQQNLQRLEQLNLEHQNINENLSALSNRSLAFELTKQELGEEESRIVSLLAKVQDLNVEEMSSALEDLNTQLLDKQNILEKAGALLLAQQEVVDFLKSLRKQGLRVGLLLVDEQMLRSATVFGNRILNLLTEAIRQENFQDQSDVERINLFISNSLPLDALSKRVRNVSSIVKKVRASLKTVSENLTTNQQKATLIAEINDLLEELSDPSLAVSEDLEGMSLEELSELKNDFLQQAQQSVSSEEIISLTEPLPNHYQQVLESDFVKSKPQAFREQANLAAHMFWAMEQGKSLVGENGESLDQEMMRAMSQLRGSGYIGEVISTNQIPMFLNTQNNGKQIPLPDWLMSVDYIDAGEENLNEDVALEISSFYEEYSSANRRDTIQDTFGFYSVYEDGVFSGIKSDVVSKLYFESSQLKDPTQREKISLFLKELRQLNLHPNQSKLFEGNRIVMYWFDEINEEIADQIQDLATKHNILLRGPAQDPLVLRVNDKQELEDAYRATGLSNDSALGDAGRNDIHWRAEVYDAAKFFETYLKMVGKFGKRPDHPYAQSYIEIRVDGVKELNDALKAKIENLAKNNTLPIFVVGKDVEVVNEVNLFINEIYEQSTIKVKKSSKPSFTPISLSNEQTANSPKQDIKPLINVRETLRDEEGKLVTRASSSLNTFGRNMTANLYKFGVKSVEEALAFPDQQLARLIDKPVGETTLYRDYLLDPKVSSLINRSLRAKLTYARNQARINSFVGNVEEFVTANSTKPLAKTFYTLYWYKYGQNTNLFNVYGFRQSFLPFVNWYLSLPETQRPNIALVEKLFIHGIVDQKLASSLDANNLSILQGFATNLRAHAPYTISNNVVSLKSELDDQQLEKVLVQLGALFPNGFKLDTLSSNRYQDKIVASKKYSLHADGSYRKFSLATPVILPQEKVKATSRSYTDRLLSLIGRPIEYLWIRSGGRSVAGAIEERILGYRTGAITPERAKQAVYQGLVTGLSWSVPTYFGEFGRAAYGIYRFTTNFYKNGSNMIAQISNSLREAKTVQEKAGLLFLGVGSGVGTYYIQSFSPLAYQVVMMIDTFNTNFINAAKSYQMANRIASSGTFRILEMIKNANSFAYLVNGVNNFLGNTAMVSQRVEDLVVENNEDFVYNDEDYPSLENQAEPTAQTQPIEEVQTTQETQSPEEATEELSPLPGTQSLTINESNLNPSIVEETGEAIEFGTYKPLSLDNKLDAVVTPKEIILHWDGQSGYRNGWTTQGTFNGLNGEITSAYTGLDQSLDSHFGVGINGVDQFLPMYENGVQYSYAASGYPDTINIEIAGSKFIDRGELNMKPEQFDYTVDLVADLLITYDLPISAIVGHHQRDLIQEMYYINADGEQINKYYFGETESLGRSLDAAVVADYLGEDGKWHSILVGPDPEVIDRQPVDYEVVGELLNPATNQPFDKGKPDVGDEFLQIVQDEVALQLAQEGYTYENGEWTANLVQENLVLPPIADGGALVYQSQTDSDWADILLPESTSNDIAKAGCGPTTVSMLLATYVDPTYTPDRVIEEFFPGISSGSDYSLVRSALEQNGFEVLKGPGSSWSMHDYFEENSDGIVYVGLKFYVNGEWTTHHTLATGTNANGEIIMHDPFFGQGAIISSDGTTITATDGTVVKVEIIGSAELVPPTLSYANNNDLNDNVSVEKTDYSQAVDQEIADANIQGTLLLNENYRPEDLDNLRNYDIVTHANKDIYLHEDAIPPLLKFIEEVKETYGYDIGAVYGYRSYQEQYEINKENPQGAAEAGRSQHQTGFAVDLLIFENGKIKQDLPKELYPIAEKYGIYHPLAWDSPHFVVVSGIDPKLNQLVSSGEVPLTSLNSFLNDVFQRHQNYKLNLALSD